MFMGYKKRISLFLATLFFVSPLAPTSFKADAALVNCTPSPGYTHCVRFTYSGSLQTFEVPITYKAGQSWAHLLIETWGAGGGGSSYGGSWTPNHGGASGGYSKVVLTGAQVGQVFNVVVGQGGAWGRRTATYGGGGPAGLGTSTGTLAASGGGLSGLFSDSSLSQPVVIAGGGGGASAGAEANGSPSGGGGTAAAPAPANSVVAGRGGTLSAGGAAATGIAGCAPATAGSSLLGGAGAGRVSGNVEAGGGGGGGYFGGGGGTCQGGQQNGGGGGGSGFVATTSAKVLRSANGAAGIMGGAAQVSTLAQGDQYVSGIGTGGRGDVGGTSGGAGGNGMVVIQWSETAPALPTAFVCDSTLYEVRDKAVRRMSLVAPTAREAMWNTSWQAIGTAGSSNLNALVYNDYDNYLYAINAQDELVRIAANGSQQEVDTFNGSLDPSFLYDASTYLGDGMLYIQGRSTGGTIAYQIDTKTAFYPTLIPATNLAPAQDPVGDLVSISSTVTGVHTANTQSVIRVNTVTGAHTRQSITGIQVDGWPSLWSADGLMFGRYNTSPGGIFRFNIGSPSSYSKAANSNVESGTPAPTLDGANCSSATNLFPTITPPSLSPDVSTGNYDQNQTITPIANDVAEGLQASRTSNVMVGSTLRLCAAAATDAQCLAGSSTHLVTSLTVANQGVYTVQVDGTVVFNPAATFTGVATSVRYTVADANNQYQISTITPTVLVPNPSTAGNTSTYGRKRVNSTVISQYSNVDASVVVPSGVTFNVNTLRLCSEAQAAATVNTRDCNVAQGVNSRVTSSAQGAYRADTTGGIFFFPDQGFSGPAVAVTYQFTDSLGRKFWGTYQPVVAELPTAVSDTSVGDYGQIQSLNVLTNDSVWQPADGSNSIATSSTRICVSTVTDDMCNQYTFFSIYDVGNFTLNSSTGEVKFTPCTAPGKPFAAPWCTRAFVSTYTIKYRIQDSLTQLASATATFTVNPPPISANSQTVSTLVGRAVSFSPLTGVPGLATGTSLTSCLLVSNACDADNSVTITGKGSFVLNPTTQVVTFTPQAGLTAPDTITLNYQVKDIANQIATGVLAVKIPAPPSPVSDSAVGVQNKAQEFSVVANDAAGDANTSINPSSVLLCLSKNSNTSQCNLAQLEVAGQGIFEVLPGGNLRFTPASNFFGSVTEVSYVVGDNLGQLAKADITFQVLPPPAPLPFVDVLSTNYASQSSRNLLINDSVEMPTSGYTTVGSATLNQSSLRLCAPQENLNNCSQTTVTTAAGTYSISGANLAFQATVGFVGPDPAAPRYKICIAISGTWAPQDPPNTCNIGQISNTVGAAPPPTAIADVSSGPVSSSLTLAVAANDSVAGGLTKISTSVRLCSIGETDPLQCNSTSLFVPNQGTYTVDENTGLVTFTPLQGFSGSATAVSYGISDSSGGRSIGTIAVTLENPPSVGLFVTEAFVGQAQTQSVQIPTNGAVSLLDSDGNSTREVLVNGVGKYSIDTATGIVTFTPATGFVGSASPVVIQLVDRFGQAATSSYRANVKAIPPTPPPPAPALAADAFSIVRGLNMVASIVSNESLPQGATIRIVSDPAQGTLQLGQNGSVTFSAPTNFVGTTSFVYEVCHPEPNETICSTTSAVISITNPQAPSLNSDSGTGQEGQSISGNVLQNDSIPQNASVTAKSQPSNGSVTFASNGSFSYTPAAGFVGVDSFSYEVCLPSPHEGECAQTQVTLTVTAQSVTPSQSPPVVTGEPGPSTAPERPSPPDAPKQSSPLVVTTPEVSAAIPVEPSKAGQKRCLVDPITDQCVVELKKPGVGKFIWVNDERVIFEPDPTFTGTASALVRLAENDRTISTESIEIRVVAPVEKLVMSTREGRPIAIQSSVSMSARVCLVMIEVSDCRLRWSISGVGTWSLRSDGEVRFVPAPGYFGETRVWLMTIDLVTTKFKKINVRVVAAKRIARLVLPGFVDDSQRLSNAMKARIAHFMRTNLGFSRIQCEGWTEGPTVRDFDRPLGLRRAQLGCQFALAKAAEPLFEKARLVSNSTQVSPALRRVIITLTQD